MRGTIVNLAGVSLLTAALLVGCGGSDVAVQDESLAPAKSHGSIIELVDGAAQLSADAKRSALLAGARRLQPYLGPFEAQESVFGLGFLLLSRGDLESTEVLERGLDADRRGGIWRALRRFKQSPAAQAVLRRVAAQHPEELVLAEFRDGGTEHLLRVLGDTKRWVSDRFDAVQYLGEFADESIVPELEKWQDDKSTNVVNNGVIWGREVRPPRPTLGDAVKRTIARIQKRTLGN